MFIIYVYLDVGPITLIQFLHHYTSSLGSRCVPRLGEGLSVPLPNYPVLCCPLPDHVALTVFIQVGSQPLGWTPSSSFLVVWSPSMTREVHRSSFRRLMCPAQDHFISPTLLIMSTTFVISLTLMLVLLSWYLMLSILLSILVQQYQANVIPCLGSIGIHGHNVHTSKTLCAAE